MPQYRTLDHTHVHGTRRIGFWNRRTIGNNI